MEEEASASMEGPSGSQAAPISRQSSEEADFYDSHHQDDDDALENGPGTGGYTASEIAGRFIQAIDTAAPIESVKGAVSKFGGILDWKERRQQVQEELDKVHGESAEYQRRSRAAEAGKADAQQELMGATGEIDDLWLSVKRAQIAEAQARKDADLAKQRLRKTEKGARERAAAKAEVDGVKGRHAAALAELSSARAELEALRAGALLGEGSRPTEVVGAAVSCSWRRSGMRRPEARKEAASGGISSGRLLDSIGAVGLLGQLERDTRLDRVETFSHSAVAFSRNSRLLHRFADPRSDQSGAPRFVCKFWLASRIWLRGVWTFGAAPPRISGKLRAGELPNTP